MESEKKSSGALIGLVVIVIILVIGGIYMWQTNMQKATDTTDGIPAQSDTVTEEDSANLDTLDQDLETVDTNIDANVINSVE